MKKTVDTKSVVRVKLLYIALGALEAQMRYLERSKWWTRNEEARVAKLFEMNRAWEMILEEIEKLADREYRRAEDRGEI